MLCSSSSESSSGSKSASNVVVAISGFLGRTDDWNLIPELLPQGWRLETIDLWNSELPGDYESWAKRVAADLNKRLAGSGRKILLGYSLGGRLALHALIHFPKLFDGAMIVSSNPGLISDKEKKLRRDADEIWAGKFMRDEWATLMHEWNSQAVFREPRNPAPDAVRLPRAESDFNRHALADSLRAWSLGAQRNLRAEIASLKIPIEFVTGESDLKFTAIARDLIGKPASGPREHVVVAHAGHRVPWDAPSQFRGVLAKFLMRW